MKLTRDGYPLNSLHCQVDADLYNHLEAEAEIEGDDQIIERWIADELTRALYSKSGDDDYLTEAVWGARHETEFAALMIAMRTADCDEDKIGALYEFNTRTEGWILDHLTKISIKDRDVVLARVKNEQ